MTPLLSRRSLLCLLLGSGAAIHPAWRALGLLQMSSGNLGPGTEPKLGPAVADYRDIAAAAGLTARTVIGGESTKKYILETTGGGVALFDYDNDGWLDIFLVNGSRLEGFPKGQEPTSHLYRNNRDGTFTDVTLAAGLTHVGWGQGVCVGDYDGDGNLDLFVTYYGKNVLYRNRGNGTFVDVTREAGLLTEAPLYSTGAAFLDYDRDGRLDLFVAHYTDYAEATSHSPGDQAGCKWKGQAVMCGPRGLKGGVNVLYRNNGDGTFTDVTLKAGIAAETHYGFTPLVFDYDNDGWPDIYVANDSTASQLYHNNRNGTFTELGSLAGVAYNEDGREQSGMGASAGDYDCDGFLDIVKTNFEEDTSSLYHNQRNGTFDDVTFASGVGVNTRYVGWGTGFIDFDNDGWPDIFIANGHVYPEVDRDQNGSSYRQRKILYRNNRDGSFEDVSLRSGPGILLKRSARGAAFGDLFNTGQMDIVINNSGDIPTLLRNFAPGSNHSLSVQLVARGSNLFAIGARVTVWVGDHRMTDEVRSGGSYLSQNDLRLHFGLGDATRTGKVEVRWPDGTSDTYTDIPANHQVVLRQGSPKPELSAFHPVPPMYKNSK
jgi:hypothetical protein